MFPGNLITELKHLASVASPGFSRKQAQRFSIYGTPRYVTCFEQADDELQIPLGLLAEAVQRVEDAGFTAKLKKPRVSQIGQPRGKLAELLSAQKPFVLVTSYKVAGEGLDLPTPDTLFLAVPISFKGKVVQQIGRITRGPVLQKTRRCCTNSTMLTFHCLIECTFATRVMRKAGFRLMEPE